MANNQLIESRDPAYGRIDINSGDPAYGRIDINSGARLWLGDSNTITGELCTMEAEPGQGYRNQRSTGHAYQIIGDTRGEREEVRRGVRGTEPSLVLAARKAKSGNTRGYNIRRRQGGLINMIGRIIEKITGAKDKERDKEREKERLRMAFAHLSIAQADFDLTIAGIRKPGAREDE
jgi:hypothetical protein